jgi:hypothetical protein
LEFLQIESYLNDYCNNNNNKIRSADKHFKKIGVEKWKTKKTRICRIVRRKNTEGCKGLLKMTGWRAKV